MTPHGLSAGPTAGSVTFEQALTMLPLDWHLANLMALEPEGWQVNLVNREEKVLVFATGEQPADTVVSAVHKIFDERNYRQLFRPRDHSLDEPPHDESLAALLRRKFGPPPIGRRLK